MKSLKFFSSTLLVLSAGIFLAGCKKDNTAPQSCKIITATPSTGDGLNFTYNNSGQVESITSGQSVTIFSYSGNFITAKATVNNTFSAKSTITLNPNGLVANVKTETSANGANWYKQTYDYNGNELIKYTYTNSQNIAPQITTATWSGGNLVTLNQNGVTSKLEYYTDKPAQEGDYLSLAEMLQGYKIYGTKNAIKSVITNGNIANFEYTYEGGKITSLKSNNDGTITNYNYQYQCN